MHLIRIADLAEAGIVCDVPAGGGYLQKFINNKCRVISIEPCGPFVQLCRTGGFRNVVQASAWSLPIKRSCVDKIVSLAGLHHLEDKTSFFREAFRAIRKGGVLCVGDVAEGSRVALFLDEFVNEYSSMGHEGRYVCEETAGQLEDVGFKVSERSTVSYTWRFTSVGTMLKFVRLLFGIDKASEDMVAAGLKKYLGYVDVDGQCCLGWELCFLRGVKASR